VGLYSYWVHQSDNVLMSQVLHSCCTGCIMFTLSVQVVKVMSFWTECFWKWTKCHNKNIRCRGYLAPRLVDICSWYQLDSVFRDVIDMSLSALLPIIMEKLERYLWMHKIQPLHAPFQVMAVGCLWVWTLIYHCHKKQTLCTLSLYDIRTWLFTSANTKPMWVTN
jgi:hypothetical protein